MKAHHAHTSPAEVPIDRRGFIVAAGAGLLATGLDTSKAAAEPSSTLVDPRTAFPNTQQPQAQSWPALQRDMNPRPDCGETSYVGHGRLRGRRALITGGDSGIGRAVAIAFAREVADVVINHLAQEEPDAEEVRALIRAEGRKGISIAGDLRDERFARDLVERAADELGGIDILVNNAAYSNFRADILDHPDEVFDQTIRTNLYAPFWLSKAVVPHMPPGGSILFTASVAGFSPSAGFLDYSASKAAIAAFSKALAAQLAAKGIRVNAVAPGSYWTPIFAYAGAPDTTIQSINSFVPLGRIGHPVEIAPVYVALAESSASYVSGSVWTANGGTGVG